jgi:hypothetical protein
MPIALPAGKVLKVEVSIEPRPGGSTCEQGLFGTATMAFLAFSGGEYGGSLSGNGLSVGISLQCFFGSYRAIVTVYSETCLWGLYLSGEWNPQENWANNVSLAPVVEGQAVNGACLPAQSALQDMAVEQGIKVDLRFLVGDP